MKITYIHHSSFAVEFEWRESGAEQNTVLLFDYCAKGTLPAWKKDSMIYVFASHKHFDHYSKKIFDLALEYPNIFFVLAKEIRMNEKYMDRWNIPEEARKKIGYVGKNQQYVFSCTNGKLYVETLASTDSGVAYIVQFAGRTIYHAGDLNWWFWEDKFDDEQKKDMERRFTREIDEAAAKNYQFDAAFLPLDGRLEGNFYKGFDYYLRNWDIQNAFPMHCWERYEVITQLKQMEVSKNYRDKIVEITADGQNWEL